MLNTALPVTIPVLAVAYLLVVHLLLLLAQRST